MKANELRIGNLVRNNMNGEILKPCDVLCDGINTDNYEGLNYGFIEPIPLTEEWLLKFGFEKQHNEEDFDYWFKNDFLNDIIWEHSEGFCHNLNYGGDIKHVHQLQNLYFALTNEELIL